MAGGTPANPAALADAKYEREPRWFPLIAGRFARGCSLSGVSMGLIQDWIPRDDWESSYNKVMAGGTLAKPCCAGCF